MFSIFNSKVLSKVKTFLPDFIEDTQNLIKNEKELKRKRIDNNENDEIVKNRKFLKTLNPPSKYIYKTGTLQQATDIKMVSILFFGLIIYILKFWCIKRI